MQPQELCRARQAFDPPPRVLEDEPQMIPFGVNHRPNVPAIDLRPADRFQILSREAAQIEDSVAGRQKKSQSVGNQALADGELHKLSRTIEAQRTQELGLVILDSPDREIELRGKCLPPLALGDEAQHVDLPRG